MSTTYAVLWFKNFSYRWEECFYSFECVNRIPELFETITVPTREGSLKGVVVDIVSKTKHPLAVYKI